MDRDEAQELSARLLEATGLCESTIRAVATHDGLPFANAYVRLVGDFMGHTYTNLLAPLWEKFPEIEPPEMRAPPDQVPSELSVESRAALAKFVSRARQILTEIRPAALKAEQMSRFGGISEVEEALEAIEAFINSPYRIGSLGKPHDGA